jgi:hypothetical protein
MTYRCSVTTGSPAPVHNDIVCDVSAVTPNRVEFSHSIFPIRPVEVARAEGAVVGADLEQALFLNLSNYRFKLSC